MLKKLAVYLGLLLAPLVAVLVVWSMPPAEAQLRVGMTNKEVVALLGEPKDRWMSEHNYESQDVFYHEPDWFGDQQVILVNYNCDRVTEWTIIHCPRTCPPWLDRAIKWGGW
jgi:hypothetical protein